jgi:hypothetical protein
MLERHLAGEVPVGEFESWVYATPELERDLGAHAYVDLLAFDYRQAHVDLELAKLVQSIYERGRPDFLLRDRAYRYAVGLVTGALPVPNAVHGLANLWYRGYEWVWAEFAGISSDFDDHPGPEQFSYWEPSAPRGTWKITRIARARWRRRRETLLVSF